NNPNTDGTFLFGAIINSAMLTSPMAVAIDEDGSLPLASPAPGMWPNPNWLRTARDRINESKNTRLLSNAYMEVELIDDLKIKSSINADLGNTHQNIFYPSTVGGIFRPPPTIPSGSLVQSNYLSWVNENTITYAKTINDHQFDFLGGFTAQKYRMSYNSIQGEQFADDKIQLISEAGQITNVNADVQEWSLLSYLARVNYNYKMKYMVSAAIRRDGSSRFGEQSKWGNFPSLSVAWILSEEEFMPRVDALSLLKLRASYGVVGNFNIGNYTHYSYITATNYAFGETPYIGRSVTNLGDSQLHWETSGQMNVGLDVNLFSNRIQFTYDYYNKRTTELLYKVDIPQATGFSSIQTNIGEIKFWGHEFLVSTRNLVGELKWNTDFNISFNRNEVVALGNNDAPLHTGEEITNPYITMVGHPIGIFYGMVHQGVYVDQEDFDSSPKHTTSQVGTVKFKDVNQDGVITQDDREIIGSPHPDFIFGMTNTFFFKGLDLSITMAGSYGNDIAARSEQFLTNLDGVFNVLAEVQDHWRSPEDPGSGKYGSLASGTTYLERDWFSSRFLYDGSYLAIKNVTLGYTMPVMNSNVFKNIRIYTSIQQALIFTNYPGNPEVNITRTGEATSSSLTLGSDFTGYPVPRTISLGVNFGF
ncbi:MAG TPA: SusC/RagA family TonB-linked outer membrane protein, partial [Bacteroides sp.]|nr:SusC/RagA family TonB-linked outer membrane protein [Bacteroides sp.]